MQAWSYCGATRYREGQRTAVGGVTRERRNRVPRANTLGTQCLLVFRGVSFHARRTARRARKGIENARVAMERVGNGCVTHRGYPRTRSCMAAWQPRGEIDDARQSEPRVKSLRRHTRHATPHEHSCTGHDRHHDTTTDSRFFLEELFASSLFNSTIGIPHSLIERLNETTYGA
jgi:hypothetical protein